MGEVGTSFSLERGGLCEMSELRAPAGKWWERNGQLRPWCFTYHKLLKVRRLQTQRGTGLNGLRGLCPEKRTAWNLRAAKNPKRNKRTHPPLPAGFCAAASSPPALPNIAHCLVPPSPGTVQGDENSKTRRPWGAHPKTTLFGAILAALAL